MKHPKTMQSKVASISLYMKRDSPITILYSIFYLASMYKRVIQTCFIFLFFIYFFFSFVVHTCMVVPSPTPLFVQPSQRVKKSFDVGGAYGSLRVFFIILSFFIAYKRR